MYIASGIVWLILIRKTIEGPASPQRQRGAPVIQPARRDVLMLFRRRSFGGDYDETAPQTLSASGRRRCGAAGRLTLRLGASLSIAAGAPGRRLRRGWRD